MRPSVPLCSVITALVALAPSCIHNPPQLSVQLAGRVISAADGQPVAGAVVRAARRSPVAHTDSGGSFSLADRLSTGVNGLCVSYIGYTPSAQPFTVSRSGRFELGSIPLAPSPQWLEHATPDSLGFSPTARASYREYVKHCTE